VSPRRARAAVVVAVAALTAAAEARRAPAFDVRLAGPFASLEACCARNRAHEHVTDDMVQDGIDCGELALPRQHGQIDATEPPAPYRAVHVFKMVRGDAATCAVGVQTARGWFVYQNLVVCGRASNAARVAALFDLGFTAAELTVDIDWADYMRTGPEHDLDGAAGRAQVRCRAMKDVPWCTRRLDARAAPK
jgi:hypothetical protein